MKGGDCLRQTRLFGQAGNFKRLYVHIEAMILGRATLEARDRASYSQIVANGISTTKLAPDRLLGTLAFHREANGVIASAAKQSRIPARKNSWIASLRSQ
ncbi:hypothetical protein [Bradyrhizobium yuanmingense]|uniref:hypothetical protein n=1 Tax=Bradyrhizobium yuanmingense TaxID=108015 RepID=UPI0023B9BD08|nr:hypothetical protein [Bradyrhizobium yuanmingense]MDF0498686.1 hypothetical protein [Bradyrhizobium yuanmingense]